MARVTGYVQSMYIDPGAEFAKVAIGPSPTDAQLLLVMMDSSDTAQELAVKTALLDMFSTAYASRREVTAEYSATDSQVSYFEIFRP